MKSTQSIKKATNHATKQMTKMIKTLQDYRDAYFSSNFTNEDRTLIHDEIVVIRIQIGYNLPRDIINMIFQYTLLPTIEYKLRQLWWKHHFQLPYITIKKEVYANYKNKTSMPILPTNHISSIRALYTITNETNSFRDLYITQCNLCGMGWGDFTIVKLHVKNYKKLKCNYIEDQYICNWCVKNLVKCSRCNITTTYGSLCKKCETEEDHEEYLLFKHQYHL